MKRKLKLFSTVLALTLLSSFGLNAVECVSQCTGFDCVLKRDCSGTCTEYSDRIKCDAQVWYCSIECEPIQT